MPAPLVLTSICFILLRSVLFYVCRFGEGICNLCQEENRPHLQCRKMLKTNQFCADLPRRSRELRYAVNRKDVRRVASESVRVIAKR
jgi:hypothetical protein